jgi:WD40 repeat protein
MSKPSSPYVGPRPFEREHAPLFFGRDREANELISLIISHTEVLLYAQSGAGKSSLVNARLIPLLEAEDFDVLPPARVQGVVEGVEAGEIQNIYAFHSLMTWAGREADPKRFARMSLAEFLRERKCPVEEDGSPKLRVAIFDQFEELFTFYPERWQERRAFFAQVREASKAADPGLRTVFVMREDYLAEIDPYAPILPEKFRNRFRLERMLEQSALSCVQEPLKGTARRFAPHVAETLIDQLMRLEIAAPDGKIIEAKEQFVELVQLQVVCQNLWDQLRSDDDVIGMDDLASADPGKALLTFYERCIQQTAEQTHVPEARIRLWFERALITPAGTRGTVFRGEHDTQGLPNVAVDALENLHIIRGEVRGRGRWYELTHDRFIECVQISRRRWGEANAAAEAARRRLEAAAGQWALLGRGKDGLLDEGQLFEAKRLLDLPDAERLGISDTARSLVDLSQVVIEEGKRRKEDELQAAHSLAAEQQRRAEEQRVAATLQRRIAKILAAVLLMAVGLAIWALQAERKARDAQKSAVSAQRHAEDARKRASARQLAGQAFRKRDDELDLALLLALESRSVAEKLQGTDLEKSVAVTDATSSVLRALLSPPQLQRLMHGDAQALQSVAVSADGKMLASGDMDGVVRLWAADGAAPSRRLQSKFDAVYSVAFSPDGEILAACGDVNGAPGKAIMLWKVATGASFGEPLLTQGRQVEFSPDGKYLATPSADKVVLWNMPEPVPSEAIEMQTSDKAPVNRIAFSSNLENPILAAGGEDHVVRLWNPTNRSLQAELRLPTSNDPDQLYSLAFNRAGDRLASGWLDKKIVVWDLNHPDVPETLSGHSSPVFALAFGSDGTTLVSGGTDRTVQRWDLSGAPKKLEPLSGYAQEVYSLAANQNSEIFAGTGKGTIAVWNLAAKCPRLAERLELPLREKEIVQCVSLLGDHRQTLALGSSSGAIFLWDLIRGKLLATLVRHKKPVLCIASSSDGKNWASGSEEGIIFWNAAEPRGEVHNEKGAISALAFRPDGQLLASNTPGAEIVFWDVASQTPLNPPLTGHTDHVTSLAFSPDGKQLAAGDMAEKVLLWDTTKRIQMGSKPLCEFNNPTFSPVLSVAFSSKWQVAAAGRDPKIRLCNTNDLGSSLPAPRLEKHKAEVSSLAFSPNGETLASASKDGALILWDVTSAQFVYSLLSGSADGGNCKTISAVAFNADGSRLVSTGSEVLVWDLSVEGWRTRACKIAGRNFTEEEWTRYLPDEKYRQTFRRGELVNSRGTALKPDP